MDPNAQPSIGINNYTLPPAFVITFNQPPAVHRIIDSNNPTMANQQQKDQEDSVNEQQDVQGESVNEFLRRANTEINLQREFNEIDRRERHYTRFYANDNINRSQYTNVPLYDEESVRLPSQEGSSGFVHATRIITSESSGGGTYILGQTPMADETGPRRNTQLDWWRMVWLCRVPICVNIPQLGREAHCPFFFNPTISGVRKVGPFKITTIDRVRQPQWEWTYYRLQVENKRTKEDNRLLHLVVCHNWTDDPRSDTWTHAILADLLDFIWTIEDDEQQQRRMRGRTISNTHPPPTLVQSRAGMNRAGLYVAASIIGKQMRRPDARNHSFSLEHVKQTIGHLRAARYDLFNRRSNFVRLLQTLLEIAARQGLVTRAETETARQVLHRCHAEIQSRRITPQQP